MLVSFALLGYPPLSFKAHLEVSKSVFGSNAVDAAISLGLLLVMHSDDVIRMYSMERLLEEVRIGCTSPFYVHLLLIICIPIAILFSTLFAPSVLTRRWIPAWWAWPQWACPSTCA